MPLKKYPELYINDNNEAVAEIDDTEYSVTNASMDRCCVTKSADQTVPVTTWTSITFNQEEYDTNAMHDNVTNNTRITIKTGGEYRINYHVKHDAMDKTSYNTRIYKNGSGEVEGTCDASFGSKDASFGTLKGNSHLLTLVEDDYLEVQFYHDNGTTQDVLSSNTYFEIYRVY